MKKAAYKKKNRFITFKIVRGTGKTTRTIRIPKILAAVILVSIIASVVYVVAMSYMTRDLSFTYRRRLEDIKQLEKVNSNQRQEIDTLNAITAEVRKKLEALRDIEVKIKNLVGIEEQEED